MGFQISTVRESIARKRESIRRFFTVLICLPLTFFVQAETFEVSIKKMLFIPDSITINVGDTIRWTNKERRQYHSVWFESLGDPEPDYFFPGEFYEKTFPHSGTFAYRCGPHPEMVGSVIVKAKKASDVNTSSNLKANDKGSNPSGFSDEKLSQKRSKELEYLVKQDCGSCHGMTLKGGLGPSLLPDRLKRFSLDDISAVILHGRPGSPMPPWKGLLSEEDAKWIAHYLKSGAGV